MKKLLMELIDENSPVSSMRVMSLICVITAAIIAIVGMEQGKDLSQLAMICGTFLGAGLTGKVTQKIVEKNES